MIVAFYFLFTFTQNLNLIQSNATSLKNQCKIYSNKKNEKKNLRLSPLNKLKFVIKTFIKKN